MSSVSFNIKITIEVEPPMEEKKEVLAVKHPQKDYKKYYCDVCDVTLALVSAHNHVCSDRHIKIARMAGLLS